MSTDTDAVDLHSFERGVMEYVALKLTQGSHERLLRHFRDKIPAGWQTIADHMTMIPPPKFATTRFNWPIPMSTAEDPWPLYMVFVTTLAYDDLAVAVGVHTIVPSMNVHKHVTLAVNTAKGGQAFHSNELTNWTPVSPVLIWGSIQDLTA